MSLSVCICLNCLPKRIAAEEIDMVVAFQDSVLPPGVDIVANMYVIAMWLEKDDFLVMIVQ